MSDSSDARDEGNALERIGDMAIPTQDGRSVMMTNEEQESIKRFFNACS